MTALAYTYCFITTWSSWLGVVHQSPSLGRYRCRSRVIYVGTLTGSAGCGTPVPQPLSVMNSVKAKGDERLMVGERVSGVKSGGFWRRRF